MKKSEQAKAPEREDGVDRISKLPDDVLQSILSRLQCTEEAIRTSILSTRWRYLWTSVPSIDIDCTGRLSELDINGFKEFVYWVLLNKHMDLDSFRLWCADLYNMLTIRQWISAAVMRKVKVLDLMFCPREKSEDIEIPHCLVTCGTLEVLKLWLLGNGLCWPNITGFQALKVLELREVDLYHTELVENFLENCPLLEDLTLVDCLASSFSISSTKLKNLRIDTRKLVSDDATCMAIGICCPKLEVMKLIGYVALHFDFEDLYSLKKAVFHPKIMFVLEEYVPNPLLDLSHAESLALNVYCIEQCYDPVVDDPISLPNLKTLEITLDGIINMDVSISFLICLPDLESLHLIIPKKMHLERTWNIEEAETMSILTRHLKKVEFLDFNEEKQKLFLARLLLGHGNELEEMVFSWGNETKFHKRSMKTINRVSKYHKASSTVKLRVAVNPTSPNYTN